MVAQNPLSQHPTLDPNPDRGLRLKRAGLDHENWTAEDDRRYGELITHQERRCTTCGAFLPIGRYFSIRVLPLDDPDWPMISFEKKKRCRRCKAVYIEYT